MNGDSSDLAGKLHRYQSSGFFLAGMSLSAIIRQEAETTFTIGKTTCLICSRSLHGPPQELLFLFLCRHAVHASCVEGGDDLPSHSELGIRNFSLNGSIDRIISNKLALWAPSLTLGYPHIDLALVLRQSVLMSGRAAQFVGPRAKGRGRRARSHHIFLHIVTFRPFTFVFVSPSICVAGSIL